MNALKKFFEPHRRNWPWQEKALVWGGSMFVFTQIMRVMQPMPFLWPMLAFDLAIWSLAGAMFGLLMRSYERWWDARNK